VRVRTQARRPDRPDGGAGAPNPMEADMAVAYDDAQKMFKDNMDSAMKSADVVSKGFQAIAAEATEYSKKSVEDGSKYVEKLLGAKSLDAVIEVQTDYFKKSYEGMVGQMTKFGEMYSDLAKEMAKPYEGMVSKLQK
jgi:phasin family protein